LRLPGQRIRASTVGVQTRIDSLERSLAQQQALGQDNISYGGAANLPHVSEAAMVVAGRLHAKATALAVSTCYRADNGSGIPDPYGPACPDGTSESYAYRLNTPMPRGGAGIVGFVSTAPTNDTIGMGGSLTDTDGPIFKAGLGVWIAGEICQLRPLTWCTTASRVAGVSS
jgi:hypothetical protein